MEVVTRQEAIVRGLKRYSAKKPCKRGHFTLRHTSNQSCVECLRMQKRAYRATPKYREKERAYAARPDRVKLRKLRQASSEHREKQKAYEQSARRKTLERVRRGQTEPPNRPSLNLCECCGSFMQGKTQNEDHDHVTGYFRGWLCNKCNTGIGLLGDDLAGVQKAMKYLSTVIEYNERMRNDNKEVKR